MTIVPSRPFEEFTLDWQEHRIKLPDGELAWFDVGDGDPVIFINGGPGDDHHYLRVLAEPLADRGLRCVLYDQRGTGESTLSNVSAETVHVDRLCEDLDALRLELGIARLAIVGHSWGATHALLYASRAPQRVARLALIALGPLRPEFDEVYRANLQLRLSKQELRAYDGLRQQMRTARSSGDEDAVRDIHMTLMDRFVANRWIYDPDVAERFRVGYRAHHGYRPLINQYVNTSLDREAVWRDLPRIDAPVLMLYGYQDVEPITQAYELRAHLPQLQLRFLNECGHIPWLDQPDATHAILTSFMLKHDQDQQR